MAKNKNDLTDDLSTAIAGAINDKFKATSRTKTAYFLDGDDDAPTIAKEFVSSGSSILDLIISNRKHGGFPVGRISEISGLEQSGKSLLAAHILLNTQRAGGLGVFIDTEMATSKEYMEAIGINLKELLHIPLETVEDVFETIDIIIARVRKQNKNRLVTIVVDSVAGVSTKTEMEADFDKDGYATAKSIIISKAMRKITNEIGREKICLIFTNQLRQKLNAMPFSDPWITPGGKAIPFHSSVRIRLNSVGQIKVKDGSRNEIVGAKVKAKIVKNRIGPPQRECEYNIYFDSGIDDYGSWLEVLKQCDYITSSGAWFTWEHPETKESIKFQTKEFVDMLNNDPKIKELMYDQICEKYIKKYKNSTSIPENVEYSQYNDENDM
ncbi:RecA RecA/RadA recombinase [Microcystis phage Mel-JY01]